MSEEIICDNTSVGIIARDGQGRILLIEHKQFPTQFSCFGWAPPSGHLDGLTYPVACFKEFEEKTSLMVVGVPRPLIPKDPRKEYACQRGGLYHHWQIFEVNWKGELKPNLNETERVCWHTIKEVCELAEKTRNYVGRMRAVLSNPAILAPERRSITRALEKEWQEKPGLEPVWYEFFQELKII